MALVKKSTSPNRSIIWIVVALVLGGAGWFLVQSFLAPSEDGLVNSANRNRNVITNFGEGILSDPRYRDLKSFGKTPTVNIQTESGNPNPFQ